MSAHFRQSALTRRPKLLRAPLLRGANVMQNRREQREKVRAQRDGVGSAERQNIESDGRLSVEQAREKIQREVRESPSRDGEAIRTANIHAENLVRRNMAQMEHERAAPRQRARAAAEDAKSRVPEAMGYHGEISRHSLLGRAGVLIGTTSQSFAATLGNISTALSNPQLDDPQAVVKVAEMGRAAIESHARELSAMRDQLQTLHIQVGERVSRSMLPPPHIVAAVSDLRVALRGMPERDRDAFVADARGYDRELLMYAIGGAPGFVTGVHEAKRKEFRDSLLAVRDSELLELETGIPTMLAALDKTEAGMRRLLGMVVDFNSADALRKLGG